MTDPYDMDLRLCDDEGVVSHEAISEERDTLDPSYIERHLRLQRMTDRGREYLKSHPDSVKGGWCCTGHAHYAGLHIRCSSPFHLRASGPPFRTVCS